ncbi:MAG TPA: serine hydrolase [Aggregatilineales bacterium]|nr:serine hydrolase [Aggregatilineales bacterium]
MALMPADNRLPRSTPEAQGVSSAAIRAFVEAVEQNIHELHSFILLRHGYVIAEGWWSPYRPEYPHSLFSLSKSFTATAIGLAVNEGRLTVDDRVVSFFPDDLPAEIGENLAAMRVRDLLSMSTGHDKDATGRAQERQPVNWVKGFLELPVEHAPGTHFVYNSAATYMLSAIIQKLTGLKLLDYLQPRLFKPLGIQNPTWETSPQGINTGGWGLSVTTEDIARFGQMYVDKGLWCGQRLVPGAWIAEATSRQISNGSKEDSDWEQGYGYQFWRCRHSAYRGDGAFGQYCVVMPDQDAVLAVTGGLGDMQAPLNLVWDHLLPAMNGARLPESSAAHDDLSRKLSGLSLLPPQGGVASPLAKRVSGQTFVLEPNDQKIESLAFDFSEAGDSITLRDADGEHRIACGRGTWKEGAVSTTKSGSRVFASGLWTSEDTFAATLRWIETPFVVAYTCRIEDDRLAVDANVNVSFGATSAALVGHRQR